MQPWKTKDRKVILEQPPWLVVEHHTVELPDGRLIPEWPWIITPDYVNVVAVTGDGLPPLPLHCALYNRITMQIPTGQVAHPKTSADLNIGRVGR